MGNDIREVFNALTSKIQDFEKAIEASQYKCCVQIEIPAIFDLVQWMQVQRVNGRFRVVCFARGSSESCLLTDASVDVKLTCVPFLEKLYRAMEEKRKAQARKADAACRQMDEILDRLTGPRPMEKKKETE